MIPGRVAPRPILREAAIPGMVSNVSLFILVTVLVYTTHLFIVAVEAYSHQWPRGGERLEGL